MQTSNTKTKICFLFTRQGFGHHIREDGPPTHQTKRGTPSMGGVAIIAGIAPALHGSREALVSVLNDGGRGFTYWKLGLTSGGVVMLVILARMRAFGRLPVGQILYLVLLGYTALVGYEYWLLSTQVDQVEPDAVTLSQGS